MNDVLLLSWYCMNDSVTECINEAGVDNSHDLLHLSFDVFEPVHPSSNGRISLHTALQTCVCQLGIFQKCHFTEG